LIGWRPTTWVLGVLTIAAVAVLLPTVPALPPLPKNDAAQTKHHMPWDLISLVLFLMLAVTGVFSAYTFLCLILSATARAGLLSIGLFVFGALGFLRVTVATRTGDRRMLRGSVHSTTLFLLAAIVGQLAFGSDGVM